MIEDLHHIPAESRLDADICVIGTGPAGIALARELSSGGRDVVLLEAGGMEFSNAELALCESESVGLRHLGHADGRARAFGETGRLWADQCLRLDPIDFQSRDWVAHSGWPLDAASLKPHYRRAEVFFKVDDEAYDARVYHAFGLAAPEWDADLLRTMFTVYTPEIDTGRYFAEEFRRSARLRVLLHAPVVQIETDAAARRAVAVRVRGLDGAERRVHALCFVLCAGGIENARLLLASNEVQREGLGNGRDLVGRFFQEHPNGHTAVLEAGGAMALQDRFRLLYRGRRRYFPKFALTAAAQHRSRVLNANAHLVFDYGAESGLQALREIVLAVRRKQLPPHPLRQVAALAGGAGEVAHAALRRFVLGRSPRRRPQTVRLQCYLEQAPNPLSRISLAAECDALGIPRARIDWQMTELEGRTLRVITDAACAEFHRLGLGEFRIAEGLEVGGDWASKLVDCAHHMGTTRMATSAVDGVVDPECQVFGIDGLYVCGSSVFPTSGYANPTLTIVALAMRLADRLKATLDVDVLAAG